MILGNRYKEINNKKAHTKGAPGYRDTTKTKRLIIQWSRDTIAYRAYDARPQRAMALNNTLLIILIEMKRNAD